jgi:hypothetical protein
VEGKPSPNAVALAPPPVLLVNGRRKALAFLGSGWQFGEMSNPQPPTPELLAELEKQALAFVAGMQSLAQFKRANSPEYREAWAKTTAAKVAYEAAAAQIPGYLPTGSE